MLLFERYKYYKLREIIAELKNSAGKNSTPLKSL